MPATDPARLTGFAFAEATAAAVAIELAKLDDQLRAMHTVSHNPCWLQLADDVARNQTRAQTVARHFQALQAQALHRPFDQLQAERFAHGGAAAPQRRRRVAPSTRRRPRGDR
jgi:hypothetical protein